MVFSQAGISTEAGALTFVVDPSGVAAANVCMTSWRRAALRRSR